MQHAYRLAPIVDADDRHVSGSPGSSGWRLRVRDFAHARLYLTPPVIVRPGECGAATTLLIVHAGEVWLRDPERARPVRLGEGDVGLLAPNRAWEVAAIVAAGAGVVDTDARAADVGVVQVVLGPPHERQPPRDRGPAGADAQLSFVALGFEDDEVAIDLLAHLPAVLTAQPDRPNSSTFASLLAGLERADPGFLDEATIFARTLELLVLDLLRRCPSAPPGQARVSTPIRRAVELMGTNLAVPWRVATLASRVGLSRSGFAARFTLEVGEPPLRYLARLRVREAASRLIRSQAPLKSIAPAVGYESLPSFCKAFRMHLGVAPGVYRSRALRKAR